MTKILATRMSSFIAKYVHKDQVRFIPGKQGPDQVRRAIDLISLFHSQWDGGTPQEGFLVSIDLQKAFDSVSWPYHFDILERWGFGPKFMGTVHSLYSTPSAQIRLMGYYSEGFNILKGTRKGCPLSPHIFAIAIETLAMAIRSNPDIKRGLLRSPRIHMCFIRRRYAALYGPVILHPQYITNAYRF